ncbi:BRCA1-associated RING domain protein 1-like isoform X2 [Neocloeon triangulifer]|uniref:BRCA1-associated RING domain protein 1-like isoform X2 n=1 Tax=Neocloeon triangulifer TaxID=2078957 RepID=UPI00286F5F67|nr:BRCA1-associated RING domain protein 1-like isoform X2 [Neocloeon triangulifer]
MPLDDSKFRHAVVGALKCLQCEICEEESLELLPGLCVSHAFCQACSTTYSACPSCKSDFKPNESITFSVDPQMLTALHSLESLLKVGTVEVETPVKKPVSRKSGGKPSLPESTLISSAKFDLVDAPIQTPALKKTTDKPLLLSPTPVPSPAKSESTVVSVTSTPARMRGRKSSLCSPVPDINKRNTKGETLVHVACIKKNFEEVERLLSLGANCCVRDYNGWTPLHEAAQSNRMDIAKILLEHGARVNAAGGEEYLTPLHDAVSTGYTEMVKLLVRFGADPDQRSIKGEIAKELTKNAEIIEALQNISSPEKDSSTLTSEITFADGRPLLIMSSGLDKNHKSALLSFLKIYPGKIVNKPSGDVKVVVVNNENNICNTSIAVLTGIAAGSWVVRPECEYLILLYLTSCAIRVVWNEKLDYAQCFPACQDKFQRHASWSVCWMPFFLQQH